MGGMNELFDGSNAHLLDDSASHPPGYTFEYCNGDEGRAYYVKGHVPLVEFMAALRNEVGPDDVILSEKPVYMWLRICRDFQAGCPIVLEAKAESRGAFKATYIQDNS